jgi:hypothetical protein
MAHDAVPSLRNGKTLKGHSRANMRLCNERNTDNAKGLFIILCGIFNSVSSRFQIAAYTAYRVTGGEHQQADDRGTKN